MSVLTVAVFTSNGLWTPPTSTALVDVILIGGGGGGGGGFRSNFIFQSLGSCGGNPGNVTKVTSLPVNILPNNVTVIVGTGGSGGAGVISEPANPGQPGTASSFYIYEAVGGYGGNRAISGLIPVTQPSQPMNILYNYGYGNSARISQGLAGLTSLTTNITNSNDFLPKPTGGGDGGYFNNIGDFNLGNNGGFIFCPILNGATAISSTYATYYGCGGAFGTTIGGTGSNYGGGGGGANNNLAAGTGGTGGNGAGGCVIITSYSNTSISLTDLGYSSP
jgi:hypothetical protein